MTDLDASAAAPVPPAPESAGGGSPFPPPAPGPVPESDDRIGKMLALIALVSLGVALITTVLWLGARGDDDTTDDPASTEAAADEQSSSSLSADEAQARLDAAQARVTDLEAEVAALSAAMGTDDELTGQLRQAEADLAAAQSELTEVRAALEAATENNAGLEASLADANARIAELEAGGDAGEAESDDPADTVVPADAADFDRWIGELLSSRSGGSRLGAEAAQCFGGAVVEQIGLNALGAGQNNAATGAARQVVIDAMVAAADTCGIDQSLIFG